MAKILIGSKLHASIILEIIEPNTHGRMPKPRDPDAPMYELKGTNSLRVAVDSPSQDGFRYAVTEVDAEFWEKWKTTTGKNLEFMRKGLVFEAKSMSEFRDISKERVEDPRTLTGLEPLAQKDDPRLRSVPGAPEHLKVEADVEHLKRLAGKAA